jgi:hypothetical protein
MSTGDFEVDTTKLHSAGETTGFAGEAARKAAARLGETAPASKIFGDFDAAHSFHSALTTARDEHQQRSEAHRAALSDISAKSHLGARMVSTADRDGAESIKSAGNKLGPADS